MLKTILIIVISVTIFGVLFFLFVKRTLKNRLEYYLLNEKKKNKKKWKFTHIILQNFLNYSLGISNTFLDIS